MIIVLSVAGIVLLEVMIRVAAGTSRVARCIRFIGGNLLDYGWVLCLGVVLCWWCWDLFGFGRKDSGLVRRASVKSDRISEDSAVESIEERMARLRRRVEELEARNP